MYNFLPCSSCHRIVYGIDELEDNAKMAGFSVVDDAVIVPANQAAKGYALEDRKGFVCDCGNVMCMRCLLATEPVAKDGRRGCPRCQSPTNRFKRTP